MSAPSPAHIFLLGGSGRTGQLVLSEALHRGHAVTALTRRASSLAPQPGLTVIEGTPIDRADIAQALGSIPRDGKIVIVSTLAQTRVSGNPWSAVTSPRRLMANAIGNAIAVAKADGGRVVKLVVMSMFGAGDSWGNLILLMRWIMRTSNMHVTLEDHNLMDAAVKASGFDFVLVRAAMLKGEEAWPVKDLGDEGEKASMMPSVSRQSVAAFLLDAVEQDSWDGRTPVVAN